MNIFDESLSSNEVGDEFAKSHESKFFNDFNNPLSTMKKKPEQSCRRKTQNKFWRTPHLVRRKPHHFENFFGKKKPSQEPVGFKENHEANRYVSSGDKNDDKMLR